MNTYFIGADKRIFSALKLDNHINIIYVEWIRPFKNETLCHYSKRLSGIINTKEPFVLVGVSFGGMVVVEISKILNPVCSIIISSTAISNNLPAFYSLAGKLKLINLLPAWLIKSSNKLTQNYFFGVKSSNEKKLLTRIIDDTDSVFLKWAIGSILSWGNKTKPKHLYHIHGTHDKILYTKKVEPDFLIKNGTHFMIYQKADEISTLINNLILKNMAEYE